MKNAIEILYNGKGVNNLQDAIMPDVDKLVTQMMAESIEVALAPLRSQIEKEGGEVIIDLKGPTIFEISTKDLSEKLIKRIHKALKPAE